ncbi:MAG: UDP-2,3-diacylglucosamine diphosphatase [Hyphomicrobium sp.]|nr:UDP-2,3-diacylglucosamine diphosphatase [Hyphomicrobium sp.]
MADAAPVTAYRAVFISDVHLGTRASQAEALLDFLRTVDAETVYLVGDIVDLWKVRRRPHWPASHNDVLQKFLRMGRKGARIVFIPGNHDEGLRDYCGWTFGSIEILRDTIHTTADGRRYAVMHGDEFDVVVRYSWLTGLGNHSYELLLRLNTPLNWVRRKLGLEYWSMSAYLKHRVKTAVGSLGAFEAALGDLARRKNVDGVICGHIHYASDRQIGHVHYVNCGDWVESCTAVVEHHEGRLEIIRWRETQALAKKPDAILPMAAE